MTDASHRGRSPGGAFAGRPALERALAELRVPREEATQALRWQRWRRYALNAAENLRGAEDGLARDPRLVTELPPDVGGRTVRAYVGDCLHAVGHLVNLLPWIVRAAAVTTYRAAIVPEPGQADARWEEQARVRAQLRERLAAIMDGQLVGLDGVPGFDAFTLDALGLVVGRSDPERMFQLPRRGGIGGPFDPTQALHWVAVLWNAARVKPGSPDYLDAQATFREALGTLAVFQQRHTSASGTYGALADVQAVG
jgi:hypothetical protein